MREAAATSIPAPAAGPAEADPAAALPAPLPALVRDVARRTRLWRAERADVMRELTVHFQDGLARGEPAERLSDEFGDARVASRLIRRSKRRNRPWWWQAWHRSLQGIGGLVIVLVVGYIALAVRYFTGEPGPIHDYLADLNRGALAAPAEDRAWPIYREAMMAMPSMKDDEGRQITGARPAGPRWAKAEQFVLAHQPQIAQLRLAASRPTLGYRVGYDIEPADQALWPEIEPQPESAFGLVGVLLPHLGELRHAGRVVALDARRAAAAGDGETALADVLALFGMAGHCREVSSVISGLVSLSMLSMAYDAVGDLLADHPSLWSDQQLRELAHRLAGLRDADIRVDYLGERYYFLDFIQRIYTDDGGGDGRLAPVGLGPMASLLTISDVAPPRDSPGIINLAGPVAMAVAAGRRDMLDRHDQYMNLLESEAAKPLWLQRLDRTDAEVDRLHAQPVERMRYLPLALLLPALSKAARSGEFAIARRDALQVAIALELHRRRHGSWPASLAELTPSLLPAIPPDRFDGKPLRYALIDGNPLLYSVGTDRDDDGGRLPIHRGAPSSANDLARQWSPPPGLLARGPDGRPLAPAADGDWILWPPVVDPPQPEDERDQ